MKIYTKNEDGNLKESEEKTETIEQVYTLADLLQDKTYLESELVRVENLISEFNKLK